MRFRKALHLAVIFSMVMTLISVAFPTGALALGTATVLPTVHTFAPTPVGSLSAAQQFTVTNTTIPGPNPPYTVVVESVSIINQTGPGNFVLNTQTCTPFLVLNNPGGGNPNSCFVDVSFLPTGTGVTTGLLRFSLNGGSGPSNHDVPLSALGVSPVAQLKDRKSVV